MSRDSRIQSTKWVPTGDLPLISKLCHRYNKGRLYEIFWEYSHLTPQILVERGARCWLYYEDEEQKGFASGRDIRASAPVGKAFVFEEIWGPCDGTSRVTDRLSNRDIRRALTFKKIIRSKDLNRPILIRAATDNQFAHIVARVLKARWVNGLIIAQRSLIGKVRFSIPRGYKFRMFRDGDQFHVSNIHKETFGEVLSPEGYKEWATKPNCRTIVATHYGKPIGFIIAERRPYDHLGDFNIAVQSKHQGKGIGSALLSTAFNFFINVGVKKVIADYLMLNRSAHVLYEKHGFEPKRIYNYFEA